MASDKELDKAIAFNIETYEQMKKDGEVDALYESYGGAQNYEDAMREVTWKSMTIEKYMESLKQEYIKEFTENQIYLGELEEKWADKRMEIEQSLVEQENITKTIMWIIGLPVYIVSNEGRGDSDGEVSLKFDLIGRSESFLL